MAEVVQITQDDIDNLGKKLDEFSAVLNPREQAVLLGVFQTAGDALARLGQQSASTTPTTPTRPQTGPSLSAGFREAFSNGIGTKFTIGDAPEAESVRNIAVDWGNTKQN